jgi:hypothetical protein
MAGMAEYIPKLLREARSGKCSIILDTQDPEGIKTILPILKTNTDGTIFFCDMDSTELQEFEKHFTFTAKDRQALRVKGKGKIYFVKNGLKLPCQVVLSNIQKRVIFNEDITEQIPGEMYSDEVYKLTPGLERIRDEEGIMSDSWITERSDIDIPGFKRVTKLWPPSDELSRVMWFREDLADEKLICGESPDHYATCALIAGECIKEGFTDVKIHHNGGQGTEDADITMLDSRGKRIWIEYAHPGSRSIKQLEQQKNHQMRYCDVWVCVCQKANESEVKAAVGRDFYVLRGSEFREYIQKIGIANQGDINQSGSQSETSKTSDLSGTPCVGESL